MVKDLGIPMLEFCPWETNKADRSDLTRDLRCRQGLSDWDSGCSGDKTKIDQWDAVTLESFYTTEEPLMEWRQLKEWEKIHTSYVDFFIFICVCVLMCVYDHMCLCVCNWRPQVYVKDLPLFFSI